MKGKRAALLAALLLLSGCSGAGERVSDSSPEPLLAPQAAAPLQEQAFEEQKTRLWQKEPVRAGSGSFSEPGELSQEQQTVILEFVSLFYESLASLQLQEPDALFSSDAAVSCSGNRAVWEYLIGIRSGAQSDLSLTGYRYELDCQSIEQQADGSLFVRVSEHNRQEFAAYPQAETEQFQLIRQFILQLENGRWKIASHIQFDSLFWMVTGRYAFRRFDSREFPDMPDFTEQEALACFKERKEKLLADAGAARLTWEQGECAPLPAEFPYDREAAVAYAREWVGRRSEEWADYSRNGGNCQNFTSQCLLAGGIPMDIRLPGIWKWVGSSPDNQPRMAGRSASFSGVGEFMDYVQQNEGYGLVASAEEPYYSGEPGDLLHLGPEEGDWRHTVIITDVITDETGRVRDYLVHSNTADLKNFPASAYPYPCQRLIKIYGYNG